VQNFKLIMRIADWLVKIGDCGKLKEVHTNVCSAHNGVHLKELYQIIKNVQL
jgi:hypothetical protein